MNREVASPAAVSSFPAAEGMKELGVAALVALAFAIGSGVGACLKERTQSLGYLSTYRDLASASAAIDVSAPIDSF